MKPYELSHLSDPVLLRDLATLIARDRATTADVLAHIAEVDARKLYLPAAYPSMFAYGVGELRLSEDAAFKRITAARLARRFPVLFAAVADGRLHLSGLALLAPHLTEETVDELIGAASHKTRSEIERLLADRFPRPDVFSWVGSSPATSPPRSDGQVAPGQVGDELAPGRVEERSRVEPLSPESFSVQFTMRRSTHELLRYAQVLLGHQVPSGDIAAVVDHALRALIERLEKRKFAAISRASSGPNRPTRSPRHIPADVKRAVWKRDGGRCTFESEAGRRCAARARLEFDHVQEVARGGEATVSGIQLRCRPHNQYGAECTFGPEFMRHKRIAAAEARAAEKAREPDDRDVIPWLRQLGFSDSEARRGPARCDEIPDASLEQRIRLALSCIGVRGTRIGPTGERRAALEPAPA